jgi:glycosyltransferase involved in cell wall biosynthesis
MNQEALREIKYIEVSDPAVRTLVPVVSVGMITYNHGPYLAEAIEGVIAQKTDFPIELIIGEDCSTDNTREIALDYQRRYPHLIRVIYSEKNVGMMGNFRRMLEACRGEFIALCEGDDYWIDPEKLREQVSVLSRFKNIDITFHSSYIKFEKQQKTTLAYVRSSTDTIYTLPEVIAGCGDFMPSASQMIRRSLILSVQDWFDKTMPPVGDYFIQVLGSRSGGAYYMNKPMSVYRRDVASSFSETTKQIDALVAFERRFLVALEKLKHEIPGQEEAFKRHIITHYFQRFMAADSENFIKMKELVLLVLKDLYEPKVVVGDTIEDEWLELGYFLKLAIDYGGARDLAEQKCGVSWQFLRVAKSLLDYGISILKMINIKHSDLSDCERLIAKCKLEAQRSYLSARWKRFRKMIIGKTRLVLETATGTFLSHRKC